MGLSTISRSDLPRTDQLQDPRPRRWTVDEYHHAAEVGLLRPDERLELINGEVYEKLSPVGVPHTTAMILTTEALHEAFGAGFIVRPQSPITLTGFSEPEPDVAVVPGTIRDYADHHPIPSEVRLLVEISDSTLAFDQKVKATVYANAGIAEYWILNLAARRLEVYRDPSPGSGYQTAHNFTQEDTVTPLYAPNSSIQVADLLP